MGKFIDLTGQRFGRLTVVGRAENSKDQRAMWNCICDCGKTTLALGTSLRKGDKKSCGCLAKEWDRRKFNDFRMEGSTVYVRISQDGKEMITDLDIWARAKKYLWSINSHGYARARICGSKEQQFHVFAFPDCPSGMIRDHINGDRLDNRRKNIRFVTYQQNSQNRSKGKRNKSGCQGVNWDKGSKKWHSSIKANGRRISLGYFSNIQDAIAARKAAEIKYFGEYRRK